METKEDGFFKPIVKDTNGLEQVQRLDEAVILVASSKRNDTELDAVRSKGWWYQ